jgi:hypothetical protein
MGALHLFGDSFTEGHLLDKTFHPYKEWKLYRGGELPLCWGDLLSNKLNMRMNNRAVGGMSNSEIFQKICKHSDEFEKDDIVIINWSYPSRFRWASCSDENNKCRWVRLGGAPHDGTVISEDTRTDIALQKTLIPCIEEIYEHEKLIYEYSKSKKFEVFFWSADIDIINNLPSEKLIDRKYILHDEINSLPLIIQGENYIRINRPELKRTIFDVFHQYGAVTVGEETNWEVQDYHLGEKGHIIQSELFYKYITEKKLI